MTLLASTTAWFALSLTPYLLTGMFLQHFKSCLFLASVSRIHNDDSFWRIPTNSTQSPLRQAHSGILVCNKEEPHFPSHWLKKRHLVLLKIKAVGHQWLQGKGFVDRSIPILPSIDCVVWKPWLTNNPHSQTSCMRPFGLPSHPSIILPLSQQLVSHALVQFSVLLLSCCLLC